MSDLTRPRLMSGGAFALAAVVLGAPRPVAAQGVLVAAERPDPKLVQDLVPANRRRAAPRGGVARQHGRAAVGRPEANSARAVRGGR